MLLSELTQPQDVAISGLVRKLTGTQSHEQIAKHVRDSFPDYDVKIIKNARVPKGEGAISAYYDPFADEDDDVAINIELMFNSDDTDITWSKELRKGFVRRLQDTIKHELMHQSQYRKRDFIEPPEGRDQRDANYEYMSRTDEIEAYAMNIADELVRKAGKDGAIDLLRMASKTAQFKDKMGYILSPDLFAYMGMWDFNSKHPVLKRLLKKVYQFIVR